MLVIREQQMNIFGRCARERFEDELTALLLNTYPREAMQAGGRAPFTLLVEDAIARALSHGFSTEREVTLFVNLTLMLGCDFDSDPQVPWAWELTSRKPGNKALRIELIYSAAIEHLVATAGEDCEHLVRALLRIRKFNLADAPGSEGEPFVCDLLAILSGFSPEKYARQGETLNRNLVTHARQAARRFGIDSNRGVLLLSTLMFMLGSGIDHDPLLPWAAKALHDPSVEDASARVDLLYREAMDHVALSLQPDSSINGL